MQHGKKTYFTRVKLTFFLVVAQNTIFTSGFKSAFFDTLLEKTYATREKNLFYS